MSIKNDNNKDTHLWADSHQRLILATALQNCRLGSSLSRILLKNNTLNSFKLLERPAPEELCYRLPSPASFPVPSQQHHSGAAPWYFTALPGYCCYRFPSQMHHFGLVLSLSSLTLCKNPAQGAPAFLIQGQEEGPLDLCF